MQVDTLKEYRSGNMCNQKETKTIFRKYHLGRPCGQDINLCRWVFSSSVIGMQDHSEKDTTVFAWSEKKIATDSGEKCRENTQERTKF